MTLDVDGQRKDEMLLLSAIQREYKILAEYKMIESEKLSGIYVIPSYANSLQWFGVLFGRGGFYANGVFRFLILLPDRFPDNKTIPAVIFQHNVIHPLVCPYTFSLDISGAFSEWKCGEDHLWQVLKYIQTIFADPVETIRNLSPTKELSNMEAAKLLQNDREAYASLVKQSIANCELHIYDTPSTEDPHYIVFEKFEADLHRPVLEEIRSNRSSIAPGESSVGGVTTGLSWVKINDGEFKPLSIE
ncbi:hypothetical protein KR222_000510 [Zaprionus bogoriensis]|nr:hypothetical protein KR222_000510 [Zaprionus bogoriensis]